MLSKSLFPGLLSPLSREISSLPLSSSVTSEVTLTEVPSFPHEQFPWPASRILRGSSQLHLQKNPHPQFCARCAPSLSHSLPLCLSVTAEAPYQACIGSHILQFSFTEHFCLPGGILRIFWEYLNSFRVFNNG